MIWEFSDRMVGHTAKGAFVDGRWPEEPREFEGLIVAVSSDGCVADIRTHAGKGFLVFSDEVEEIA